MEEEVRMVGEWLLQVTASGIPAGQIGVFARDETTLKRAEAAVRQAGLASTAVDRSGRAKGDGVRLSTMHLAKGLEYRAVAVVACDDDILPSAARIEAATDTGELEEILESERQLLYVACTRAREQLLVTGLRPTSEFHRDLAKESMSHDSGVVRRLSRLREVEA
jgi:superfamily I DNA/RNA helicase